MKAATADTAATYEDFKITMSKIEWLMPRITPPNQQKIRLLRTIEKNKPYKLDINRENYVNFQLYRLLAHMYGQ